MKDYCIFSTNTDNIDIAILIKKAAYSRNSLKTYYVRDKELEDRVIAVPLEYEPKNKLSTKFIASYLDTLLPELNSLGIKTLYVADSKYFQYLTKENVTNTLGSITYCKIKGYEHIKVIAGVNYQSIMHNPNNVELLDISINSLIQYVSGYDISKPKDIIKDAKYLYIDDSASGEEVMQTFIELDKYVSEPVLTVDIETKSLIPEIEKSAVRFSMNAVVSIAFSKSDSEGIAIYFNDNKQAKEMLKNFFIKRATYCKSNLHTTNVYHNGLYDIKQLIYHLFMQNPGDIDNMLYGINIMCTNIDDTMVMKYVSSNNVQDNSLGLKENILAYTGQYAVDVKDVSALSIKDLLEYNLKDVLGTRWLYDRLSIEIVNENQAEVYKNVLMPTFPVLLEMMLVGLPLDMSRVKEVKEMLEKEFDIASSKIKALPIIKEYNEFMQNRAMEEKNAKLKKKVTTIDEYKDIEFNPGSPDQRTELLYSGLGLPILDFTKTKKPASGNKTIVKLLAYAKENGLDENTIVLLEELVNYTDISKILNTFIKAFELYAFDRGDGTVWLNGDQILCGTVSGRLGSRNP